MTHTSEEKQRAQELLDSIAAAKAAAESKRQDDIPSESEFIGALQIEDKVTGGLIPFELWDFQREFIDSLMAGDRVFGLKARQLGITWTVLAHLLYLGVFAGDRLFLIASQSGDDAIDALHRLRILYRSIPPGRWTIPAVVKDNTEQIAFANGSRYESMKATKRAGRSKAAYAVLADEFAFWDWPEEQLASLDSAAQRLYAVTTGNGPGDLAHTIWLQAEQGLGRWQTIFYPWHVHPGRDDEWYRLNVTEAPEPRLARREHAANPRDAFAAPEGVFFERWQPGRNETDRGAEHNWPTVRAVDFGFRHPACLWIQTSPQGQPIVVAEFAPAPRLASAAMTTSEFVANIQRIDGELGLFAPPAVSYCDPAGKAAEATTGVSEFELLQRAGLAPVGEASSIRDGCVRLFELIADADLPLLVSTRRCPWLTEALTTVRPDKNRPDLYDQKESSPYQHILDALRYWAVNRRDRRPDYEPPEPAPGPASGLWGRIW